MELYDGVHVMEWRHNLNGQVANEYNRQCSKITRRLPRRFEFPLVFTPQPESGYTVTSLALPELITEGHTLSCSF